MKPWVSLFFIYMGVLSLITIFVRDMVNPYQHILSDFMILKDGRLNLEFVENISLFIPYTFLYLQAFKPRRLWKAGTILALSTTVCIETFQLVFWMGEFQISDIVYNVLGGLIGCGIWCLTDSLKK